MKISSFTQSELDVFRTECNFSPLEESCFELKAKNCTDVQLALRLNISESTAAVTMRRVRAKITTVLEKNSKQTETENGCGGCIISHTMNEWARIPDFLSKKNTIYVYSDYRTDNDVSVPRIKIGDGLNPISEIPFATMSITDEDMEYWDEKPDSNNNDFGKTIIIGKDTPTFIFPSDGYLMLVFNAPGIERAEVRLYGASGQSYFTFSKVTEQDRQTKEVFVRKGMRCEYVSASDNAEIKFVPLV